MNNSPSTSQKNGWMLTPLVGLLIFVLLYLISTFLYPGGSTYNPAKAGFDWLHNYWCDLTGAVAKNGAPNTARPVALAAMFVLCTSLAVFWYQLPALFENKPRYQVIRYTGIPAMGIALFMFTGYHDTVIHLGGVLAGIALVLTFDGLYRYRYHRLFWSGMCCLALILFNYYIYETGTWLTLLPIVQKITFGIVAVWVCVVDIQLYRQFVVVSEATTVHKHR